jgi:hypothetical protein
MVGLQEEYRAWLDNLPPNLESSTLADKLQAVVDPGLCRGRLSTSQRCKRSTRRAATVATDRTMALDSQRPHTSLTRRRPG